MDGIGKKIEEAEKLLKEMRKSPLRTMTAVIALAAAVSLGAFLKDYFGELGKRGATATVETLESGDIGKLLPSRITPLSYRVSVINASTELKDEEVRKVVAALQDQVHMDLAPIWAVDAKVTFVPKSKQPDPKSWWLLILDDSDQVGTLGYHDVTPEGLPLGKVFARTLKAADASWSLTASHELLAMLVDPRINLTVFVQPSTDPEGTVWAYEITTPCGGDENGYKKNDVLVSDFVTPAWFESWRKPSESRFDFLGKINKPFTLLPGGHAAVFQVKSGSGWTQKFGP
jgi:hypothetical protein